MTPTTPVLIDTDPGIDDAIAIFLALASPELDVVGLTTVVGNAPVEQATTNALRLLHFAGRDDVPVAQGAGRPVVHPPRDFVARPSKVHGSDGLGEAGLPLSPVSARQLHAVDLMAEAVRQHGSALTIVALGPLTNVALFFALHPELASQFGHLVVMGGGLAEGGNYTPAAEFNFYSDPVAADRVFQAMRPTTLVSLDVTQRAVLTPADFPAGRGGRVTSAVHHMLDFYVDWHIATYGTDELPMHDSLAVAYAVDPTILTTVPAGLGVAYDEGRTRGQTLVDRLALGDRERTAEFAVDIDVQRFRKLLLERLVDLDAAVA
jgi:inosine-uridine nucleoside N-ribohydrolase